jgi:CHAD domain-containing protein
MAYRLERGESVSTGVKRIAREQLKTAIEHLQGKSGVSRDEAVHEARKHIKKVRALMRLVQTELEDVYSDENGQLRGTARKLSQMRDAAALIQAFDDLSERQKKKRWVRSAAPVRKALLTHKQQLEQELGGRDVFRAMATKLQEIRRRVKRWPLEAAGFPAIEEGLESAVRRGRKSLAEARQTMRTDDLHEWRKRVKDHWYHVRLLEDLSSDAVRGRERSLKDLEDAIGESLNLGILRERIRAAPEVYGGPKVVEGAAAGIEEERKRLIDRAFEIGAPLYGEKPKHWLKTIRTLWKQWHQH